MKGKETLVSTSQGSVEEINPPPISDSKFHEIPITRIEPGFGFYIFL